MTYEKAKAWSEMMVEIVKDGRMPPWHADPKHGKFSNDRSMSKADRETLLAWVDQGCPKGAEKDLPPPRTFFSGDGWRIGKPDAIVKMPLEYKVPAQAPPGGVPYRALRGAGALRAKTSGSRQPKPSPATRPSSTTSSLSFSAPGESLRESRSEDGIGGGLLVATAAGRHPHDLQAGPRQEDPEGVQARLPDALHAQRRASTTDCSSVGIVFAKEPPQHLVHTRQSTEPLVRHSARRRQLQGRVATRSSRRTPCS